MGANLIELLREARAVAAAAANNDGYVNGAADLVEKLGTTSRTGTALRRGDQDAMTETTLSAEAQAMVDEGMRLALAWIEAEIKASKRPGFFDPVAEPIFKAARAESDFKHWMLRIEEAMAAPQAPPALDPIPLIRRLAKKTGEEARAGRAAMKEREMLELAAEAAGIASGDSGFWDFVVEKEWNPLHDDGDALRLAVTLSMDVLHRFVGGRRAEALCPGGPLITEPISDDPLAATRRAIVRAAAEIGRAMKEPRP